MTAPKDFTARLEKILTINGETRMLFVTTTTRLPGVGLLVDLWLTGGEEPQKEDWLVALAEADCDAPDPALKALEARMAPLRKKNAIDTAERSLAELTGLTPYVTDPAHFAPTKETVARREAELARMTARHDAVAAKFQRIYGMRLPRHLAIYAAFLAALDEREKEGLDSISVVPFGLTRWFDDGALERKPRKHLDARLDGRFRRDPAELVSIARVEGEEPDTLHWGLWYDDPAELPSFVVSNDPGLDAETTFEGATMFAALQKHLVLGSEGPDNGGLAMGPFLGALSAAIDWFAPAVERACAEDGVPRWADVKREDVMSGIGPALPEGSGDPRWGEANIMRTVDLAQSPAEVLATARQELAAGQPAFALVLGRDLHFHDEDEMRKEALELQVAAYEALGRHGLAEIAKVHFEHRDLENVSVLP